MNAAPVMNAYETENRMRKAIALTDVLYPVLKEVAAGSDQTISDLANCLDAEAWKLATKRAGVNPPSDKTKAVVISMIEDREQVESMEDTLAGLPQA